VGLIDQLSVLFLEGNLKKMSTYPIRVGDRSHLPKPTSQFRASIRTPYAVLFIDTAITGNKLNAVADMFSSCL
jgi:hypothetical protein